MLFMLSTNNKSSLFIIRDTSSFSYNKALLLPVTLPSVKVGQPTTKQKTIKMNKQRSIRIKITKLHSC